MSTKGNEKLIKELSAQGAKWVEEQLPIRMQEVGVDKAEVKKQLETEADHWVKYNIEQLRQGMKGTPSPDFYQHEERPELDPVVRTGVKEKPPTWDQDK